MLAAKNKKSTWGQTQNTMRDTCSGHLSNLFPTKKKIGRHPERDPNISIYSRVMFRYCRATFYFE